MKFASFVIALGFAVLVLPSGCGKRQVNKEYLGTEGRRLAEIEVQMSEISTTARTPKGNPARVYEVTIKDQKHVVVVVGDPAATVEIPNARFVIVGGKKAELNLATAMSGSYMVPVIDPVCGYRQLDIEPAAIISMARANQTLAIPMADLVIDALARK
jgi:hypothetical protein